MIGNTLRLSFGFIALVASIGLCSCAHAPPEPDTLDESSRDDAAPAAKPASRPGVPAPAAAPTAGEPVPRPGAEATGEGAGSGSFAVAQKLLEANRFEDLLGVFEPDQAQALPPDKKKDLLGMYVEAARRLREKFKDVAFSSLFCERGLLLDPRQVDLMRIQIRNYLSPEMQLVGGAEELAEQLVAVDREDQENQLLRGKVALEQGKYDVAVEWLTRAARSGREQNSPAVQEAWKLLDEAKGHQEELKSSLSMTKELEAMMARAKAQSAKLPQVEVETPAPETRAKIILYMTRWCRYCAKARDLLKSLKVDFSEKDIEDNPKAMQELVEFARNKGIELRGVPVVRIGDELVLGYNPQRIEALVRSLQ